CLLSECGQCHEIICLERGPTCAHHPSAIVLPFPYKSVETLPKKLVEPEVQATSSQDEVILATVSTPTPEEEEESVGTSFTPFNMDSKTKTQNEQKTPTLMTVGSLPNSDENQSQE